ncbi:hypothetical protein TELCIR_06401 [Teladorsagia circumcincta]|uniref:ShKT domain-containing protein n=1 Tax=Teladorsagia circumcincta TaxID=45464 RepID=A0A2G9UN90_TELCI|nr:hypothetical protein TELCIR_06401 [Teladorsagia circumcincta]
MKGASPRLSNGEDSLPIPTKVLVSPLARLLAERSQNLGSFQDTIVAIGIRFGLDDSSREPANVQDPQLVQAAIQNCPQTCGYCCLTPAYTCQNKLRE